MEVISPILSDLFSMTETMLSKPCYSDLIISSFSILHGCSFYFPEKAQAIWNLIWKNTVNACKEKSIQKQIAKEGFRILSLLCSSCSSCLSFMSTVVPELREFFDLSSILSETSEMRTNILKRSRKVKEPSMLKYGIIIVLL